MPIQVMGPDGQNVVEGAPSVRRRLLDWGVFHVEHAFLNAWRRYHRALRQRNSALRLGTSGPGLEVWERELTEAATSVTTKRQDYLEKLRPQFNAYLHQLVPGMELALRYRAGWPDGKGYQEELRRARGADIKAGYTRYGPHRGELLMEINGHPAREALSRGEQKLVGYGLRLAQAALLTQAQRRACIILVDDLPAELDRAHREKVVQLLESTRAQVFVTATDEALLEMVAGRTRAVFHVEQGQVREVV